MFFVVDSPCSPEIFDPICNFRTAALIFESCLLTDIYAQGGDNSNIYFQTNDEVCAVAL